MKQYFQLVNNNFVSYCRRMKWKQANAVIPSTPGLYAIYLDGKIAYIGCSTDLRRRVTSHALPSSVRVGMFKGRAFRSVTVKFREGDCMVKILRVESRLIARLRPALNRRGNPKRRELEKFPMTAINLPFRKFVKDFGGQAKVATLLRMSPGHVSLLYNGKRKVTVKMAERIHIATQGKISKESLVFPSRSSAA